MDRHRVARGGGMKVEIEVDVPKGWKVVAYRAPLYGENILNEEGRAEKILERGCDISCLILERDKERIRVFHKMETDYPLKGDFISEGDSLIRWEHKDFTALKKEIWKEITEEENEH